MLVDSLKQYSSQGLGNDEIAAKLKTDGWQDEEIGSAISYLDAEEKDKTVAASSTPNQTSEPMPTTSTPKPTVTTATPEPTPSAPTTEQTAEPAPESTPETSTPPTPGVPTSTELPEEKPETSPPITTPGPEKVESPESLETSPNPALDEPVIPDAVTNTETPKPTEENNSNLTINPASEIHNIESAKEEPKELESKLPDTSKTFIPSEEPKKSNIGLLIAICIGIVVVVGILVYFIVNR